MKKLTDKIYKRVDFICPDNEIMNFVFDFINKKYGRKETGYNVHVGEDGTLSFTLFIRRDKIDDVLYLSKFIHFIVLTDFD